METRIWDVTYRHKTDKRTVIAVVFAKTYQSALKEAEKKACGWSVVSVKPTNFDFPEE